MANACLSFSAAVGQCHSRVNFVLILVLLKFHYYDFGEKLCDNAAKGANYAPAPTFLAG